MRTFYIFNIRDEYANLTKNNPYHLYKMLDYIYNLEHNKLNEAICLFDKISINFNPKEIDIKIFKNYSNNYFYTKFKNIHQINNFYRKESSKLTVKSKFLLLQSNVLRPTFIDVFIHNHNLFFCDFENKDYFFIDCLYV